MKQYSFPVTLLWLICCQSNYGKDSLILIDPHVSFPKKLENMAEEPAEWVQVPKGVMITAKVVRPRAELRGGPGVSYPLLNQFVGRGEMVVEVDQYQKWRKVYVPSQGLSAWLHYAVLGAFEPNQQRLKIPQRVLPTVFVTDAVEYGFKYPSQSKVQLTVPKGKVLLRLRQDGQRSLVMVPEFGGMLWIASHNLN